METIKEKIRQKNPFLFKIATKLAEIRRKYRNLNWIKTIYVNFRTQKVHVAFKLPIFIYGRLTIVELAGKIVLDTPNIWSGMIRLGQNTDRFSASKGSAMINIPSEGKLIFKGSSTFALDYAFDISGICIMGDCIGIGSGVCFRCWNKMSIGTGTRIAIDTRIFDTNFHYMRNVETGKVMRMLGEVHIGNFCWIGNRSTVMKDTYLPDYSIVAGNSLLNKDLRDSPEYPTFAGTPAKFIRSGNVRVFDNELENTLHRFFEENPDAKFYIAEKGIIDETDGLRKISKKF